MRVNGSVGPDCRVLSISLLVLALAACSSTPIIPTSSLAPTDDEPRTTPAATGAADPLCGQGRAASSPETGKTKGLAVSGRLEEVVLYDIEGDSVASLGSSRSLSGPRPRFRSAGFISLVQLREQPDEGHTFGQESLIELDIVSGRSVEILRLPNIVMGYDWSPDGATLAYQVRAETPSELRPVALCLYDSRIGTTTLLRSLAPPIGTGTGQREETAVAWSPRGQSILVVDTAERPSIVVVDLKGSDIVSPIAGTFARWLGEDLILFQQDPHSATKPWVWFTVSSTTNVPKAFGLPADAYRPTLSPQGDMIAFDNGDAAEPAVFVFDIEDASSRRVAGGYLGPAWLGTDLLAATRAVPCPPADFCPTPWSLLGATVGIDPATGKQRQLALPTTYQTVVSYGHIDVLLGVEKR